MYQFKFNDKNGNYLMGKKISELKKFVTFDSESETWFYDENENMISREIYETIDNLKKYKIFKVKVITASFIDNKKIIKNKIYINGDSLYKSKKLDFYINKFENRININSKIEYFKDSNYMCKTFYTDILDFVKNDKNLKIFCHNAKHDWLQCKTFKLNEFFNDIQIKNFRFNIPRFLTFNLADKKQLIFLDTVNYFKSKLETLGLEVGIKKLKDNVDFSKDFLIDEKFLSYAMVDSIILAYKLLEFNENTRKIGSIGYGIASTSYNIFRTSFMENKIYMHKNPCLNKIERKAYAGGRVEAFKLGKFVNVKILDITSQYSFQMLKGLPVRYIKSLRALNKVDESILYRKFFQLKDKYCLICEVVVDDDLKIPVTPYKHKGKLMFVNGKIQTVLCEPEITLLISLGQKVIFRGLHIYSKKNIFEKFVNKFFELKNKYSSKLSLKNFYKLILNSCYGKTGEREIEEIIESCDKSFIGKIIEIIDKKEYHFSCLSGIKKASKFLDQDAKNAFCPIAAFITSYARSYLYESMYKIGLSNILYCDTDSIFTTLDEKEIINKLNVGKNLGEWNIEKSDVDVIIHGVKDYIIFKDGKIINQKLKGIDQNNSIEVDSSEWVIEKWSSILDGIKLNDIEHQRIYLMEKKLTREYTKAKCINIKNKEIILDGKKIKYIDCRLKHFNIDELK